MANKSFKNLKEISSCLGRVLSSSAKLDDFYEVTLYNMVTLMNGHIGCIFLKDSASGDIKLAYSYKRKQVLGKSKEILLLSGGGDVVRKALKENKTQIINDVSKEPQLKYSRFIKKEGIKAILSVPLVNGGKVIGALTIYYKNKLSFTKETLNDIELISSLLTMAIVRDRLGEEVKQFSNIIEVDILTGLYNHKHFLKVLDKKCSSSIRYKYPLCLAIISISGPGAEGDSDKISVSMLKETAEIIKKNVHPFDWAFRYSKNKFAIIMPHSTSKKEIHLFEKIKRDIIESSDVSVNIGLAAIPFNASGSERLIEEAEHGLALARNEGKNKTYISIDLDDKIKCAFCPPEMSPFYMEVLQGLKEAAEGSDLIKILIKSPDKMDYAEQHSLIERILREGIDVLALHSEATKATEKLIEKINKANIPVYLFNMPEKLKKGNAVSYILYDQIDAGRKICRYIARLLRGKGKIAILEGLPNLNSIEKKQGIEEELKKYPNIKIIASERADWDPVKARKVTLKIVRKNPDIDAICALDDDMAIGAVNAISDLDRKGELFITGIDGSKKALQAIKEGHLTATLSSKPTEMGRILMLSIIRNMIKEETVKPKIFVPTQLIDSINVEQFLQDSVPHLQTPS